MSLPRSLAHLFGFLMAAEFPEKRAIVQPGGPQDGFALRRMRFHGRDRGLEVLLRLSVSKRPPSIDTRTSARACARKLDESLATGRERRCERGRTGGAWMWTQG